MLRDLLEHMPALVKAYGRWPSFLLVVLTLTCQLLFATAVLLLLGRS